MATDTIQPESNTATRANWDKAFKAWSDALEHAEQLTCELSAVTLAYEKLQPDLAEIEPIIKRRLPYRHAREVAFTLDLEAEWERFLSGEGKVWWGGDRDKIKADARADFDAIADFRARYLRAGKVTGYDDLNDQYDAAWDAECEARGILFKTPAPDAQAATVKLDLLFGPDELEPGSYCDAWTADWVIPAIADAKRIMHGGQGQ